VFCAGSGCTTSADLAFVADSSGSVTPSNWNSILNLIVALVDRFNIGQNLTRAALVRYSNNVEVIFNLTSYFNRLASQNVPETKCFYKCEECLLYNMTAIVRFSTVGGLLFSYAMYITHYSCPSLNSKSV